MIKKDCKTKEEAQVYLTEQKIRMERGYLTVSERKELAELLKNPESLVKKEIIIPKGKPIITNIDALKVYCLEVRKDEDIQHIIKDLKETLTYRGGLGLSANQIGYNKRISYIKVPNKIDPKTREITWTELILINAKIIEKTSPIKVRDEQCLSFLGVSVTTKRYVFITVEYLDEKLEKRTVVVQDLESLVFQHEIAHQEGKTIFDFKWKAQ